MQDVLVGGLLEYDLHNPPKTECAPRIIVVVIVPPPPGIIADRTHHGRHGGIPAQDPEKDALAGGCPRPRPFSSDSPTTKANTASLSAYLTISLARKDPQV